MICERCKKNEATVHITKIMNGIKHETKLCEKCAKETENLNLNFGGDLKLPDAAFSFQNILSGLMDYINQAPQSTTRSELTCKSCGTTYSEFRNNGILGCSDCYENFNSTLMPVVKRVQGNLEHIGKLPQKSGRGIMEKKRLLQLREELQRAIASEEYEKAAELRDKIRELQKGE